MLNNKTIAFLGAGSMAEAMISGLIHTEKVPAGQIIVTNKSNQERLERIKDTYGVRTVPHCNMPYEDVDLFILAMKPNGAEKALANLKDLLKPNQLVISILAGITTSYMEERLHEQQKVIRVMPNTSSMIQESATAMSRGNHCNADDENIAKELLGCMGEVFVIDERQMDVFTGMAGSGPAYFYYLMEQMENIGKLNGIDAKTARKIAAQTLYGAAKMVIDQDAEPAELRKKVTSPNGTTAAGLAALEKYHGGEAITKAVTYAAKRSKEISEELDRELILS